MQGFQIWPLRYDKRSFEDSNIDNVFNTCPENGIMAQTNSNGIMDGEEIDFQCKDSRMPSLENDELFYDCTDGGNLSPRSVREFLRKPGAPTELPSNDNCTGGGRPMCGLCTKLRIPPRDLSPSSSSPGDDEVDHTSSDLLSSSDDSGVPHWDATPPTSPRSPGSDDVTVTSPLATPKRRKTSLRSPNSAPDTPRRKSVRFADALGLDLETVKLILENETAPDYPNMALGASKQEGNEVTILPRYLSIVFQQPGGQSDFISRVYSQNVCLENVVVSDFTVLGTIKVRNITFNKSVKVRYSCDGWRTFGDVPGSYVRGSCDGPMDRFSFGLSAPRELPVLGAIEFAICYTAGDQEYWDNNYGHNYRLECNAQAQTLASGGAGEEVLKFWTHFL